MSPVTVPDPDPESLVVIHAELDRRQVSCDARSNTIDTKAGLLLAAAGVLIGFNADKPSVLTLLAELAAAAAGAGAIWSMFPRRGKDVEPKTLFDDFHTHPVVQTRMELIRARLQVLHSDEKALGVKADRFKGAAILLGLSGLLFITHTATGLHPHRPTPEGHPRPAVAPTRETATVSVLTDNMIGSPAGTRTPAATPGRTTDPEDLHR